MPDVIKNHIYWTIILGIGFLIFIIWILPKFKRVQKFIVMVNDWISSRWYLKYGILLIPAIPPALLAGFKSTTKFDHLSTNFGFVVFCGLWPALCLIFGKGFSEKAIKIKSAYKPSDEQLTFLFNIIDNVVGEKWDRFRNNIPHLSCPPGNTSRIFETITQPDQQINALTEGVYTYFMMTRPKNCDVSFRVALAIMKNKYIEDFHCFYPKDEQPHGKIKDYKKENSGFTKAKKLGTLLIIPDIKKELKKHEEDQCFVKTDEESSKGSIIVYPITYSGDIIYCLSIMASEANYFKQELRTYYKTILRKFEKRICLEHTLKVIKDNACRRQANGE